MHLMEVNMRSWLWKGMLGAAVALPALNGAARAQGCSLATLTGEYTFGFTAYTLPFHPNGPPAIGEGIVVSDGNGHLTQRDFGPDRPPVFAPPGTEFGTYTVDPDCTGSLDITLLASPHNGEIKGLFVISNGGRHIHLVLSDFIVPGLGESQAVCCGGPPNTSADLWKVESDQGVQ
jgi:hypothetical protein